MPKKRLKLHADLYKKVYLIRRAEQGIIDNYASDAMKTPMHMSMGEEAVVAGVVQALGNSGQVLGTYAATRFILRRPATRTTFLRRCTAK